VAQVPDGGAPGYSSSWGPNWGPNSSPVPLNAYLGYFDYGGGNPNTDYNPNAGQYDQGDVNFTSGGDSNPSTAPPTTFNAATAPNNADYKNWTWEQIINNVMSLGLPDRSAIATGRWTGIEHDSSGDTGRFYIWGDTWGPGGTSDSLVYLSPELTTPNAPWPVFQERPLQALGSLAPGPDLDLFEADGPYMSLDPSTFAPPIEALEAVQGFYYNAVQAIGGIVTGLGDDSTQFQGKAGGAFAQLIGNLYQQVNYVSSTIGPPGDPYNSYAGQLYIAALMADIFMIGIWNSYAAWSNLMEFSPLGSILAALIQGGVVVRVTPNSQNPDSWYFDTNATMDPGKTPFGDLAYDPAWVQVETLAKKLWANALGALDTGSRNAIAALTEQYNETMRNLMLLNPPAVHDVSDTGSGDANANANANYPVGGGINFSGLNSLFGDLGNAGGDIGSFFKDMDFAGNDINSLFDGIGGAGSDINSLFRGIGNAGDGIGSILNDAGDSVQSLFKGVGNAGDDISSLFGHANSGYGGDGQTEYYDDGSPNSQSYSTLQNPLAYNALAQQELDQLDSGGTGSTTASDLQQALDDNGSVQSALQSALTSGQVPADSQLSGTLQNALADSNKTQQALDQAATSGTTSNSALQSALADNTATENALESALASGQVPANSTLAHTLQNALTQSQKTQSALTQALAGGTSQGTLLSTASGDNAKTQTALTQALLSGQVSSTSPLHSTLQTALADTGKTQAAINQALTSSGTTSSAALNRAITDNQAVQKELRAALASGQVPATGPLRDDLNRALADSNSLSTVLHQALAKQGVLAEPNYTALTSTLGLGGTGSGSGLVSSTLGSQLSTSGLGATPLLTATRAAATSSTPLSSGSYVYPTGQTQAATTAASGEDAFPMYSPMAGGGMMGSQYGNQEQERERSTWLSEDEDVWGTDPATSPQVIGRDSAMDEEPEDYDAFVERTSHRDQRRTQPRRMDGR
jgi:hypothetical protein